MQISDDQFHRSLQALRRPAEVQADDEPLATHAREEIPADVVQRLLDEPPVRLDRVAEVKARLDAGTDVSPREVAAKVIGRLVADRLR